MSPTKRARLTSFGWDEALVYEERAEPPQALAADQVLIEVEACGVCHRDLIERAGRFPFLRLPITPGHEVAGRVLEVGSRVTGFEPGDRAGTLHRDHCGACTSCVAGHTSLCASASWVFGILADGGYASVLRAPERALYALPEDLPPEQAAVLHCTFGTAYRDLAVLGQVKQGERVLITGANGGVGSAAIQIAVRLGAEVSAVVRDPAQQGFVSALGAAHVVVDAGDAFHRKVSDMDFALDAVGQATFNSSLRTLRVGGRMVVVGNIVPERAELNLGYVITRGLTLIGGSGATARDMAALLALHREQPFEIPIHARLPLSEADRAQRRVREGRLRGRVVLVPEATQPC